MCFSFIVFLIALPVKKNTFYAENKIDFVEHACLSLFNTSYIR